MAGLRWVVVALTFVLSAGGGSAAVDQNWLTSIIDGIKKEYALRGAFSLAVSVQQDQDVNDLQQIFQDDPADRVTEGVSGGDVYRGARVVAAGRSAALSRVLDDVQTLASSSRGGFLVIYSDRSPCDPADPSGLAGKVDVVRRWSGYAFVFSEADRAAGSLQCPAVSKLGLDNIFRCYEPAGDALRCDSCAEGSSAGGEVAGPRSLTGTDDEAASGGEVGGGGGPDDAVASPEGSDRGRKEGKVAKQCKRKGCDKRKKGGVSRKTRKGRRGAARGEPPRGRKGKGGRGGRNEVKL
uniref:uncharacterized protein LOC120812994 isoform X2 n=1 Tax=Gasterosteus aculeatus aculeatus TaxID=481459 RepID=UPI001A9896F8|nr:uncharacterized protein LOC120812994 isoform X2 [Gasterosteus aculeatus aculeatus]